MMNLPLSFKTILLGLLAFTVANQEVNAKTMYRWVDENGKVSFSDQIPPTKAELKHDQLDKNANVIKVTERAKTKAELAIEKRLDLLSKQREKIILQQKAKDKKLLSSFLNVETMNDNYKIKQQSFKSQEYDASTNLKKLAEKLETQQKQAASYDAKSQKVPASLLEEMQKTKQDIAQTKQAIKELAEKKAKFEKSFAADRARFESLTKASTNHAAGSAPQAADVEKAVNELGLFTCDSTEQCEKAWDIAKEFIKTNSSMPINTDTDKLVMADDPVTMTDVSLSISKLTSEDKKQQIFLDIRCQDSVQGKDLCVSAKVQGLRVQFNSYIKAGLTAAANPTVPTVAAPTAAVPAKK